MSYDRQKLFFKWALVVSIIALVGYTFYFEYERFHLGVKIFKNNRPLFIRVALIIYFLIIYLFINKIPHKLYKFMGYFIVVPIGWAVSLLSYLTIGYEGMTVTGYIFLILASSVIFDFTFKAYSICLFLIISFHFTLLSFYHQKQSMGLYNHLFFIGLSGILGLVMNYVFNIVKKNETLVLKERELLLKEIHHRVKNNLQIISSLLNLQSSSISDDAAKTMVKESQSRVKSMALIHQLLYQSEMFNKIDFSVYLEQLLSHIHKSYTTGGSKLNYNLRADKVALNIDLAVPLGLISNELITNAYKYAYKPEDSGIIDVLFLKPANNRLELTVSDNGVGLPSDFDHLKIETLGTKLVYLLAKQLDASVEYEVKEGTKFRIEVPVLGN